MASATHWPLAPMSQSNRTRPTASSERHRSELNYRRKWARWGRPVSFARTFVVQLLMKVLMKPHFDARVAKQKNPKSIAVKGFNDGVPDRILTCDAEIRRRTTLRGPGCRSDAPKSLTINEFAFSRVHLVVTKLPVPSLHGDAVVTDASVLLVLGLRL